jgi:hypothetical protein
MLPHKASLSLTVNLRQVNHALALNAAEATCDTAYFGGISIIMCT